ncbi:MAG TPA: site-specific integrase, partial [Phytomonospora sp.]
LLVRVLPTPVARLNRAVAVGMARGPAAGLSLVDELLADPALRDYHLLPGVRGDLLLRLGRDVEARREFERAAALTRNAAERAFLLRRAEAIAPVASGPLLGEAAASFLARADLDASTVRSYGQTLRRLTVSLGERVPLAEIGGEDVARVFAVAWGDAAARTWNRHRAALRSFAVWAGANFGAGLARRVEEPVETVAAQGIEVILDREDVALRERVLWWMLRESGATVKAVLGLNVEDLDLDDRRAPAGTGWVQWRSRTARLLPALIGGRSRGPLFLADRRPGPGRMPAPGDLCPETGRGRLSYERSEYLFKRVSGMTLRVLRQR